VVFWAAATTKFADVGGLARVHYYYDTMLVATGGYVIIMGILVIIYITDDTDYLFETLFVITGCCLNLIAGIIALVLAIMYDGNFVIILLAALMIASGVIMLIDFIRAVKK
jgi:hypothetical protein